MKTALYIETIYRTACPYCGNINLTNIGDVNDVTGIDPEEEYCKKCGKEYKLFDNDIE